MGRFLVCGAVLLALLAPVRAAEDKTGEPEKPATAAQQYQALVQEHRDAMRKFFEKYREAEAGEERQKVFKELYPKPDKFAAKMLDLAVAHTDDPAAIDALVWAVTNSRGATADEAIRRLREDHIDSQKLTSVCQRLMYTNSAAARDLLRVAMEKSPHKEVQGWACYALGKGLLRAQARQTGSDAGDQASEAEKLLERVARDFADVKSYRGTLADLAAGDLFELRHLAIGCVAPEIEGEDIDEVALKLSDYRGKVVVLDFWGNW